MGAVCRDGSHFAFLQVQLKGGYSLATNTVNQVLNMEKQAEENINNARQEADRIIEDAKNTASLERERILSEAHKKADEVVAKVQLDVDKMYDNAKEEAQIKKEQIVSASAGLKNEATKIIRDILF